jgi:tetratricopeptide (TPR) repeat protein
MSFIFVSCKSEVVDANLELDPKVIEQQQFEALSDKTTDENGKCGSDYFSEANRLLNQGEYEEAVKQYDLAIKVNPKVSVFYRCKGDALILLNKVEEATFSYDKAAELYPTSNMSYISGALANQMIGNFEQAYVNYSKALDISNAYPSDSNSERLKNIYFGIGVCNLMLKDNQKSIEYFDKALDLDKLMLAGYTYKAIAYSNMSKYDKALVSCDDGLNVYPQFGLAYSTKGMIYTKLGKPDEAFKQFEKAIELNIQEPMLYFYRAITYLNTNETEKCIEDLTIAISMQPELITQIKNNEVFASLKDNESYKKLISN